MRRNTVALILAGTAAVILAVGVTLSLIGGDGDSDEVADEGPPVAGGTLVLGLEPVASFDPAELDPAVVAAGMVSDLVYDGLTTFDDDGKVTAALAASWEAGPDARSWRFHLRGDAKFHDGRPVTAADVVGSLHRLAARGPASSASVQLEVVDGYRTFAIDRTADTMAGLLVLDTTTVEIRLTEPFSTLPELLAAPAYGIVPADSAEPGAVMPVGSGPFEVRSADAEGMQLVRAASSTTHLDGIDVIFYPDAVAAYDALVAGSVDLARVPAERADSARQDSRLTHESPLGAELFYVFNLDSPAFADTRTRAAIEAAVNRDAIVEGIYRNTVSPLTGVVPEGIGDHDGTGCNECGYNPQRARDLLAAVFGDQPIPEMFIDFDEGAPQDLIAQQIHTDLRAVGIPATMRPRPFDDGSENDFESFVASGNQQIFRLGWIGVTATADAYLTPLFSSASPDNIARFRSDEVDSILNAARAETDPAKRDLHYRQAEEKVMAAWPIIPLVQFRWQLGAGPRARGVHMSVLGTIDGNRLWLAPES